MTINYNWTKFYSAFADKLLSYETDRQSLLKKLQNVFNGLGTKFQKLEEDDSIVDIDPFTVFGMFNKGLSNANRISIIKAFAQEFDINKSIEIPRKPHYRSLQRNRFNRLQTRLLSETKNRPDAEIKCIGTNL